MSTSPSWFDQEKFSRLVKKVGPKNLAEPAPGGAQPSPGGAENSPASPVSNSTSVPAAPTAGNGPGPVAENIASTSRISLVSKPPSLLSENRALPALPRRTSPLPGLKSLFQIPPAPDKSTEKGEVPEAKSNLAEEPEAPAISLPETTLLPKMEAPVPLPELAAFTAPSPAVNDDDLAEIWQKMALLNEELAQTIQERDHAMSDINLLRDQLSQADLELAQNKPNAASVGLTQLIRERDAALAEVQLLKEKGPVSDSQKVTLPEGVSKTRELVFLTQERDQSRKEYADLRKQFETLKREQSPVRDDGKVRKDLEMQLEGFRQKLEEKNREIAAFKAAPPTESAPSSTSSDGEIAALQAQLLKAKEDTTIAQRGLQLSQKALQETRDTLREATEGTSLSRHNFDNLKNECASLQQQLTALQAQNEQLSRELAAAKQRQSGRLP